MSHKSLQVGMQAPDFQFETPWSSSHTLYDVLGNKKTVLMFLRFYGCRLCQIDMARMIRRYDEFVKRNAQILVVLQSEAALVREQAVQEEMPLTILCDPDHRLFDLYGVGAARSRDELMTETEKRKLDEAVRAGMVKIENGGFEDPLQLPAVFVIRPDRQVDYAYYGQHGADIPSVDELLALLDS